MTRYISQESLQSVCQKRFYIPVMPVNARITGIYRSEQFDIAAIKILLRD
jgi:hypothetical protein